MANKEKGSTETPLMKQYNGIREKYPNTILLFRVGDFYETFGEDAIKTSKTLGIVLTKRANGAASELELAGFPYHSLDVYLPKLVRAGHRVAICDQLEDPKATKTIVKRGVTEVITPGVVLTDRLLEHNENNYLAVIHLGDNFHGISFIDISTGEFLVAEGNDAYISKLVQGYRPAEIIYKKGTTQQFELLFGDRYYNHTLEDWVFSKDYATEKLLKNFETISLKGFGIDTMSSGVVAAGVALHYLEDTQHGGCKHITTLSRIEPENFVWLDKFTIRNLELVDTVAEKGTPLIKILDHTCTPMGARLMRKWVLFPLKNIGQINDRLDVVSFIKENESFSNEIYKYLKQINDLERIISRLATSKLTPREAVQLRKSLDLIIPLRRLLLETSYEPLKIIADQLNPCDLIRDSLAKTLTDDPPVLINKGNVIREGVSDELDHLRKLAFSGKDYLVEIQQREAAATGISSLKIGFNNVFGYYLEVTNIHKSKVPTDWIRKQTLANAERYITPELKEYEEKILGAEEGIQKIEVQLYNQLLTTLFEYIQPIQLNAHLIARLDCLYSFAHIANENNYCKPNINDSYDIDIREGRHPVIEKNLPIGEYFQPNDVLLNEENQQIIMITGPNMAGKSALLRQTALISLMAQIGSFVPAKIANLGYLDKIFTRVGASDNISSGESTFMVEMNETASIINNLSSRSLILLDEIGRGTSTYDGISIAWAIAEYIHEHPSFRPKTLFATHYHELNEMAGQFERIKNYNVAVQESTNKIIFLRKLVPGGSEHSFGIHVARMAGIPKPVIKKANQILSQLEGSKSSSKQNRKLKASNNSDYQLSLFQIDDPNLLQLKEILLNIDVNTLTPIEALFKIHQLKEMIQDN